MAHSHGEPHGADRRSQPRSTGRSSLRYVDDVIAEAYLALRRGDLTRFLQLHAQVGISPKKDRLVSWARRKLWRGELDVALKAFDAARTRPTKNDLLGCAAVAEELLDESTAARARALAVSAKQ